MTNERHGNKILNMEQHLFTRRGRQKIPRKNNENCSGRLWNVGSIRTFCNVEQQSSGSSEDINQRCPWLPHFVWNVAFDFNARRLALGGLG